jgi:hypothetical protein
MQQARIVAIQVGSERPRKGPKAADARNFGWGYSAPMTDLANYSDPETNARIAYALGRIVYPQADPLDGPLQRIRTVDDGPDGPTFVVEDIATGECARVEPDAIAVAHEAQFTGEP